MFVLRGDDTVALTGFILEDGTLCDPDSSSRLNDRTDLLQSRQRHSDPRSADSQNHCQLIVGERDDFFIQAICRKQQPTAQSLLEFVTDITERGLSVLNEKHVNVFEKVLANSRRFSHHT